MLIYNLISYSIVCNTNTTTNAYEIKALTRVESESMLHSFRTKKTYCLNIVDISSSEPSEPNIFS